MIIFKRVYLLKFYNDEDYKVGCATMRGRKDAHDMLVQFNKIYSNLTVTDIKRIK